jgi:hypothetical protein
MASLQVGAAQKDVQQQAQAVRLLTSLLGTVLAQRSQAHCPGGCVDALAPALPALAQLLVIDLPLSDQAKGKQPMGQPLKALGGQLDRAALQLEAAYLLLFALDLLSPQVRSCCTFHLYVLNGCLGQAGFFPACPRLLIEL